MQADDWELFFTIECDSRKQPVNIEDHMKKMKSSKYIRNLTIYPEIAKKIIEKRKSSVVSDKGAPDKKPITLVNQAIVYWCAPDPNTPGEWVSEYQYYTGTIHMNWGWGGLYNGWYDCSSFNQPDGNFL